jgi:hypothetical protein
MRTVGSGQKRRALALPRKPNAFVGVELVRGQNLDLPVNVCQPVLSIGFDEFYKLRTSRI